MRKTFAISDSLADEPLRYQIGLQQMERHPWNLEENSYTKRVEIPKLDIADTLLEILGIPTRPRMSI